MSYLDNEAYIRKAEKFYYIDLPNVIENGSDWERNIFELLNASFMEQLAKLFYSPEITEDHKILISKIFREKITKLKFREKSRAIPRVIKKQVLELYGYKCANCLHDDNLHIHHIKRFSEGGLHTIDNLVPLCQECHAKEHEEEKYDHLIRSIKSKKSE